MFIGIIGAKAPKHFEFQIDPDLKVGAIFIKLFLAQFGFTIIKCFFIAFVLLS